MALSDMWVGAESPKEVLDPLYLAIKSLRAAVQELGFFLAR